MTPPLKQLQTLLMKKLSKLLLAVSFVVSLTTSAFAVTAVSWGGAYTESQKLGYGDPTAKKTWYRN
jgi:putative spermidine/putrescine transport system substrate-binding protein